MQDYGADVEERQAARHKPLPVLGIDELNEWRGSAQQKSSAYTSSY